MDREAVRNLGAHEEHKGPAVGHAGHLAPGRPTPARQPP